MHRIAIRQRPRERRHHRRSLEQVSVLIDISQVIAVSRHGQGQLDPFVMCEFEQERKIVFHGFVFVLQKVQKLLRDLQKVGRLRLMFDHELTNQFAPAILAAKLFKHRKGAAQQIAKVVEEQIAIDRHAAIFDAGGSRVILRVTNMCGEFVLLALKIRQPGHWQTPAARI